MRGLVLCCCAVVALSAPRVAAQGVTPAPVSLLDVPFISQSEALCGGAAAAMVLRYWGERGIDAEAFASLVDRSAAGIRTDVLTADLQRRGWTASGIAGSDALLQSELARGRPVLTLIEDRPGTFHYVVLIGWHERGAVFHDPARGPYVVMSREAFDRRWDQAGRWMAVVTPGTTKAAVGSAPPGVRPAGTCGDVVAEGVKRAQANDLAEAERLLASAAGCPAAARELAGIRVMQKRWVEAEELAATAIASGDTDRYAWQVLATSRFVQDDRLGALDAWNAAGEPRVDLVQFDGLTRTRHRVVERLVGFDSGSLLTREDLLRGRRRLAELPSASSTRLDYVPVSGGLAEVRGFVGERRLVPSGRLELAAMGLIAATRREVSAAAASPTGGGERIWASWRFWANRTRLAGGIDAPAPWGGLWSIEASAERQAFTETGVATAGRRSAGVRASNWLTGNVRWTASAGVDVWRPESLRPRLSAGLRYLSRGDRFTAELETTAWLRGGRFSSTIAAIAARSSTETRGTVGLASAGFQFVTTNSPLDTWPAGDTGHARSALLRAHPVLDDGRLRIDRLGRKLVHGTAEIQRWTRVRSFLSVGGAVFIDAARTTGRIEVAPQGDVDAGGGARLALPGVPGVFRVDVARGLRDGRHAISVAYGR